MKILQIYIFSPKLSPTQAITAEIAALLQQWLILHPALLEKLYFYSFGERSHYPPMTVNSFG